MTYQGLVTCDPALRAIRDQRLFLVAVVWEISNASHRFSTYRCAQTTSMPRKGIPQPLFQTLWQAIARLLETPAVPRAMMWVGGVALVGSCVFLAYLIGVLLARVVAWGF